MAISFTPLEPTISQSLGTPDVSFSNQALGLFSSTSFLWSLGITACVLVTASVFVRGGIYRIQASESGIRKSNEEFKRGAEGLLGVLALWLIIYTFNQGLLTGDVGLDKLRTSLIPGGSVTGGVPSAVTGGGTVSGSTSALDAIKNDPAVRAQLNSAGITVNKSVCSDPSQTSCTTVGGLPVDTISMLLQLKTTCPGSVEITGGTEAGHQSHGPGKTPVDISIGNPQLNSCIRSFQRGPDLNWCNLTYQNFGYIFCDEKNTDAHWHIFK